MNTETEMTCATTHVETTAFAGCFSPVRFRPLDATKASTKRASIAATLKDKASLIIESCNGIKMLCAATILAELDKLGCRPAGINNANALGDVLGKHCLSLPCVSKGGKRRYAMHLINDPDEKKAAAQAELNELSREALGTLIVG